MPSFQFFGYSMESIILVGSSLLILSVLASRISSKSGFPMLLIFLGIGMLAGTEGPGRISFDDYELTFAVGALCLSLIVFDGGLRTSWKEVRPVLGLGLSMSIIGTVVTAGAVSLFSHYALNLPWIESTLLGAIVSSTDAAAVFSILRARSLSLKGKTKQLLEFEAGSNDPVAVFLTVTILTIAVSSESSGLSILTFFFSQAGLGLLLGWLGGKSFAWLINHIGIEYEGLYSVLLTSLVVFLFGLTSFVGGSGLLSVYVAGVILGNSELFHKRSIFKFIDGVAWISQILVFLTLGLLAYPSHLLSVWKEGILLGIFMMFIARPLSVFMAAPGGLIERNQKLFVSWIGLRGAAPIILATLPWGLGLPNAEFIFNLVFFVVLISVISQGISIPWMAKFLKVTEPTPEFEIATASSEDLPAGFVSIEINVNPGAQVVEKKVSQLPLPAGVLLTRIRRGGVYSIPNGGTVLLEGDKITALAKESSFEVLRIMFGEIEEPKAP